MFQRQSTRKMVTRHVRQNDLDALTRFTKSSNERQI